MKSLIISLFLILSAICAYLLVTDTRVLVDEYKVWPGQNVVVDGYGDLGRYGRISLVCSYFSGRKVLSAVYWYAPNNHMGRDSCPFINKA